MIKSVWHISLRKELEMDAFIHLQFVAYKQDKSFL